MPRYGKYDRMRHNYLREHKKAFYATLLFDGKLVARLNEIDDSDNSRMKLIIKNHCPEKTTHLKGRVGPPRDMYRIFIA